MDPSKLTFLQNVLRYTTSHTSDQTSQNEQGDESTNKTGAEYAAESAQQQREMSPERKKWLENALNSMSINPIDEMKKCLSVIQKEDESLDRKLEALETLKDWCEDINFAIDFHKLDGYALLPRLLNDQNTEIRALSCDLIATCAQNNPYCQETLLKSKILPLLLQKLDKDVDDVKIKALYAVSCLTRDYEPGQLKLLEGNGLDILIRSLSSSVEKLQTKCCFFCSSICNNKSIKSQLTSKKLVERLIEMYRQEDIDNHEHILSAIRVLIDDNPLAIDQAKQMKEVNFKQILANRIQLITSDPRYDEEREMAKEIFDSLFQN